MIDLNYFLAKEDKTIARHNEDLMKCMKGLEDLGYLIDENIIKMLTEAIYYHDLGKIQKGF